MPPTALPDLPPLLPWKLTLLEDKTSQIAPEQAFSRTRQLLLSATLPDGSVSEPFVYAMVHRSRLDAVVVAPHFVDAAGERCVMLRSAFRPPVALRPLDGRPVRERPTLGSLWELVAGLVEPNERSERGLSECAARELYEELGVRVSAEAMQPLGPSTFPSPGVVGERLFFFHVRIDELPLEIPSEDGSVLERQAQIVAVRLSTALDLCKKGFIEDAKTEIGLRRLAEI